MQNLSLPLPRFTFINGPKGSGKSTLASLLYAQDSELMRVSFAEPIRNVVLGTFYPDEFFNATIDLRDDEVKKRPLPIKRSGAMEGTSLLSIRDFMIEYGHFLKKLFGPEVFGELAVRTCEENERYYLRFVFDDCRFREEIAPLIRAADPVLCAIIHLYRDGCTFDGDIGHYLTDKENVRHITLHNDGSPMQMLEALAAALQPTSESAL